MTGLDPHLVVRAGTVYVVVIATTALWLWRRPPARARAPALLAAIWNVPALLALNVAAPRLSWWTFDADGGLLLGMPVDLFLAWAWLWGAIPALAFPRLPIAFVLLAAGALDVVAMPFASPVVRLGPQWLVGETAGLVLCLLPAQLLARWTAADTRLPARILLQMVAFAGLTLFVVPAVALDTTGWRWVPPLDRPLWQLTIIAQVLAPPMVIGAAAVHEFLTRGDGTPVPFDPPRRLVTSGLYAYVRNPMQVSGVLLLLLLGAALESLWVASAGLLAHLYAAGLAGWDEDQDLHWRFGDPWTAYRRGVRAWLPRLRPWFPAGQPPARLYVSATCGMCAGVGRWFARRGARQLAIVPAAAHPSRALTRITYEPADGSCPVEGVAALGRACEHLHLGWMLAGLPLRLPVLRPAIQLLVDASGGEPRAPRPGRPSDPLCPPDADRPPARQPTTSRP